MFGELSAERGKGRDALKGRGKENGTRSGDGACSYTFRELAVAANNFRDVNLIGQGGFGSVYKGRLESGQVNCGSLKFPSFLRMFINLNICYYVVY